MSCGHHPDDIDQMPLADVELFVSVAPLIWAKQHPLAEIE